MQWFHVEFDTLLIQGVIPVFAAPIITTHASEWPNHTVFKLQFLFNWKHLLSVRWSGKYYTLVLTSHDDCIWGIGGGVTFVSRHRHQEAEKEALHLFLDTDKQLPLLEGILYFPVRITRRGSGGNYAQTTL